MGNGQEKNQFASVRRVSIDHTCKEIIRFTYTAALHQSFGDVTSTSYNAAIFCPKLHNPLNGLVRATKKIVGSQAMYECFGGHVLIGDIYRTCLPNGEWSGDEPTCRCEH